VSGLDVSEEPHRGYRRCAGIFLLNTARQVFVGQRADTRGSAWQLPQGGIDDGEDPVAAGLREMREEIGTDRATLLASSRVWRAYDLPPALARRIWGGRYRGQTQKWLAFRFDGTDADIRIDLEDPEFRAWRWLDPRELADLVVPFKRDVYLNVVDEFRPLWA
jgi:putative (di)nucleoside polyphosphate hydrolase